MKKRTVMGCMAAILVILLLSTSFAAEIGNGLDLGGQMRWRIEYDGKDFDYGTAMNEMSLLRTRVNLKVTAIEDAVVYFQMQDSRNLGVNSAELTNDTNLGVHQGYLKLKNLFAENLSLQLGRFEAPYGRHRLMGNVGWSNVGRSFDGIRLKTQGGFLYFEGDRAFVRHSSQPQGLEAVRNIRDFPSGSSGCFRAL